MTWYHGSPNKFDRFSYDSIRTNGTSEGVGFYFTNQQHIAKGYGETGYIYTVTLTGEKSLSSTHKTITRSALSRFLVKLDALNGFLSNYGDVTFEGLNTVLEEALSGEYDHNDSDTDIIASIYNGSGEDETVLTLCVSELGYDHILLPADWGNQELYIALSPDIIHIVDTTQVDDPSAT